MVPTLGIFIFSLNFAIRQIRVCWISKMTMLFSYSSSKMLKQDIFGPKFRHFCFSRNFAVSQIRGCWFQIWQYSFQIPPQKYQSKAFLVPNLGIFAFSQNLQLGKLEGNFSMVKEYGRHEVSSIQSLIFASVCVVVSLTGVFLC